MVEGLYDALIPREFLNFTFMELTTKPNVLIIIGSASADSSNSKLIDVFISLNREVFNVTLLEDLGILPHFDPGLSENLPLQVSTIFSQIQAAEGLVICSPEYIFSIPARLKNLFEWCVSTSLFDGKPIGLITASAQGNEAHAQLIRITETLGARLSEQAELIIPGIKGKFDSQGQLNDPLLIASLCVFSKGLKRLIEHNDSLY